MRWVAIVHLFVPLSTRTSLDKSVVRAIWPRWTCFVWLPSENFYGYVKNIYFSLLIVNCVFVIISLHQINVCAKVLQATCYVSFLILKIFHFYSIIRISQIWTGHGVQIWTTIKCSVASIITSSPHKNDLIDHQNQKTKRK